MSARAHGRAGDNHPGDDVENGTTLRLASDSLSAAELLGRELTRLRLNKGLSLRSLARLVQMTAHSGLVDYERGIRIPPEDLMVSLVAALQPGSDGLILLHRAAFAERAQRRLAVRAGRLPGYPPESATEPPAREPSRRRDDQVVPPPPESGPGRCARCGPVLDAAADTLEQLARSLRRGHSSSSPCPPPPAAGPPTTASRAASRWLIGSSR